jgi:hypothetical protein
VLDVLLEPKLKHLISLIKHYGFYVSEINVASFDVIDDSTSCSHEDFYTSVQFANLFIDRHATVNCYA